MPQSIPVATRAFACAAVAAILATACGGGSSPDPTPTPAVSPVASSVAIDLALADRLLIEGDTDSAVGIYSAAVLRGGEAEQQHGLWQLARLQFELGEEGDSAQNLASLLALEPEDDVLERRATLLLGYSKIAQGRHTGAKDAFEKYIRLGGPATPYAQIKLAEIASTDGDHDAAVRGAQAALAAQLAPEQEAEVMLALARYQEAAGDIEGAAVTLETLRNEGADAADVAEALWEMARLAAAQGEAARQQDLLRELVVSYPSFERALEALPVSETTSLAERALVLYRNRENDSAREAYELLLSDPDPAVIGDARYRLGILSERVGDPEGAIAQYTAAIEALSTAGGVLLDDAYWDRGLVHEAAGRLDEAVESYSLAADTGGDRVREALQRAGMIRYRQGLAGEAVALWERSARETLDDDEQSRTYFWLARAYRDLGDAAQERGNLEAASESLDYYGLRAAAQLSGQAVPVDPPALEPSPADWASVEAWIAAAVGPEPSPTATPEPAPDFFASPGWLRAEELVEAGIVSPATDEVRSLITNEDSSWVTYRIARRMAEEGYVRTAALAASNLLGYEDPPPTLLRLVYPAKHLAQVNAAAQEQGVSPVLMLSLIRQESYYDATAVSPVGAMGLTQVMPATGAGIATVLGVGDFQQGDLLEPETNLRFGAYYLGSQMEGFGGNVGAALSAYNGGPGNAARWTETAGNDVDLLVETIDFDETKSYVELVLSNLAFYRYAYGASDTLSLPLE
jgi:soluble lytic murein transglycosylase